MSTFNAPFISFYHSSGYTHYATTPEVKEQYPDPMNMINGC